MVDVSIYADNNTKKLVVATVGKIGYTLPGNRGTMVSGESYKIGTLPAGAKVVDVAVTVSTAFNGTTPTADVGYTGATAAFSNDLALDAEATTAGTAGEYLDSAVDILFTPTLSGCTVGDAEVVITFVETNTVTGMFTA